MEGKDGGKQVLGKWKVGSHIWIAGGETSSHKFQSLLRTCPTNLDSNK